MQTLTRGFWQLAAPLGVVTFWSGMAVAARLYPGGYDWSYQTISVLLYPERDPHGCIWAWLGLELCGVAGIAWTVQLAQHAPDHRFTPRVGVWMLRLGFACMCAAVLPDRLLPWSKGHELLAILAFSGLCAGVTRQMYLMASARPLRARERAPELAALLCSGVPLLPLALAAATQAYLGLARPALPWVTAAWRARGIPIYLSFGFWEWVSCALFSACLLALWLAPSEVQSSYARGGLNESLFHGFHH